MDSRDKLILENIEIKEEFFFTAIKNLIRKNNFYELVIQQKEGQISKKQFDQELKDNPNKYISQQIKLKNTTDLTFVIDIYRTLGPFFNEMGQNDISLNEISELFSVDSQQLVETVEMTKSYIRKKFNM